MVERIPEQTLPGATVSAEICMVDAAMAATWIATRFYPYQRHLSDEQLGKLVHALRAGSFSPCTITFARCPEGIYLVDGQHRLHAIVEAGIAAPLVIATHEVPDMESVHHLYGRIDIGRSRLGRDAPDWRRFCDAVGVAAADRKPAFSCMRLLAHGFTLPSGRGTSRFLSVEEHLAVADSYRGPLRQLSRILEQGSGALARTLRSQGFFALACVTLKEQPVKAQQFWEAVAQRRPVQARDGVWWAGEFLLRYAEKRLKPHEVAYGMARCWNLYYTEETREIVRPQDTTVPIRIEGTVYDGSKVRYLLPRFAPKE